MAQDSFELSLNFKVPAAQMAGFTGPAFVPTPHWSHGQFQGHSATYCGAYSTTPPCDGNYGYSKGCSCGMNPTWNGKGGCGMNPTWNGKGDCGMNPTWNGKGGCGMNPTWNGKGDCGMNPTWNGKGDCGMNPTWNGKGDNSLPAYLWNELENDEDKGKGKSKGKGKGKGKGKDKGKNDFASFMTKRCTCAPDIHTACWTTTKECVPFWAGLLRAVALKADQGPHTHTEACDNLLQEFRGLGPTGAFFCVPNDEKGIYHSSREAVRVLCEIKKALRLPYDPRTIDFFLPPSSEMNCIHGRDCMALMLAGRSGCRHIHYDEDCEELPVTLGEILDRILDKIQTRRLIRVDGAMCTKGLDCTFGMRDRCTFNHSPAHRALFEKAVNSVGKSLGITFGNTPVLSPEMIQDIKKFIARENPDQHDDAHSVGSSEESYSQ